MERYYKMTTIRAPRKAYVPNYDTQTPSGYQRVEAALPSAIQLQVKLIIVFYVT